MITQTKDFLEKELEVIIDRPLGSKHPKHRFVYEANYGYIPNTKSRDGEELVVIPKGKKLSDEEIEKQTNFQEQWFKHIIIRK